ncbi:YlqD protein [Anoxybacillus vitaminiphilus]|uniref:YlqD protein n=1 Tax=Paranoxybacillus vitaminiphilus TaxID=581036 RepID=A0A327YSP7_9BACL|nr:YlqD family protein [Anoxybacillus vitaminiphilus]RAK23346.1 YlqD protein [Anoxybacillus vitaminiphilus]
MKIIQTVEVKQILTEESKAKLLKKFEERKRSLQQQCEQLRFELKRLEKAKKHSPLLLKQHFEKEINDRLEKMKLLDFQIEQLHILPLGSELKEREIQALVEVNIGDKWEEIIAPKTIIIEDGIVKEIR